MIVGETVTHIYYVRDSLNNPVSSAALPTGTVLRNGVLDTAPAVSMAQLSDLAYRAQFTIPASYVPGDSIGVSLRAEHPAGTILNKAQDIGTVLRPESEMFGTVSRIIHTQLSGAPAALPVGAYSVVPILTEWNRAPYRCPFP